MKKNLTDTQKEAIRNQSAPLYLAVQALLAELTKEANGLEHDVFQSLVALDDILVAIETETERLLTDRQALVNRVREAQGKPRFDR